MRSRRSLLRAALIKSYMIYEKRKRARQRRMWAHEINLSQALYGEFHTLYPQLIRDEKRFCVYFRMPKSCFNQILESIGETIKKLGTNYGKAISPEERLAVTLRYLATGDSYKTIAHSFRMGFSTVADIVEETCTIIWNVFQPIYMPEPTTEIWENNVKGFLNTWRFPNCLGALDGKHVTIWSPNNTGSEYFCYLKKFSIVLMAIVDYDYKFVCIDVGTYGKNSDGGIFDQSFMGRRFANGTMNVPPDRPLLNQTESSPLVLIGDQTFALTPYLLRPYPTKVAQQDKRKDNFNEHLCKTRRIVENGFGILTQKWRIFFRPIEIKVETAVKVVKTACLLHSVVRTHKSTETSVLCENELENEDFDLLAEREQLNLFDLPPDRRRATTYAIEVRERFVNYFSLNNEMNEM